MEKVIEGREWEEERDGKCRNEDFGGRIGFYAKFL